MNINTPQTQQIPQLKALWQQAFGDTPGFIEGFFQKGFSPRRCRCVIRDDRVDAALYWFDCTVEGEKWAYLYAVATEESCRGQGLCAALLADTHRHLRENGYTGAVLVPAEAHLWRYYGKFGYRPFGGISCTCVTAGNEKMPLEELEGNAYESLRQAYLPRRFVCQQKTLGFYRTWGKLYRGDGVLLAAAADEDTLYVQEFLGDAGKFPQILAALGFREGKLRTPGGEEPCGMYLAFCPETEAPSYLGFPLD